MEVNPYNFFVKKLEHISIVFFSANEMKFTILNITPEHNRKDIKNILRKPPTESSFEEAANCIGQMTYNRKILQCNIISKGFNTNTNLFQIYLIGGY